MARHFQTITPIDGTVYLERDYADSRQIAGALDAARKAHVSWKRTGIPERADLCRKVVQYFLDHQTEIAYELTMQMGRPIRYSPAEITGGFLERATYMIDVAEQALADDIMEDSDSFKKFVRREPLGSVMVLSPWNYPYLTSVNAVIPAVMAGNCVILKHAQQTPLCAERYEAAFRSAGMPDGVFQSLHLDHDQVASIIADPRIDHVSFTGSVTGGMAVQKALIDRFVSPGLELGGKDPAYVRADADISYAVDQLVDGSFFNSGQSCCGVERIYVHDQVYQDFVEGFVAVTRQYQLGDPREASTTLGPMVSVRAADFARQQIAAAEQQGAKALIDLHTFNPNALGPAYMAPQVLVDVDHSMSIMTEETFAPVVGIMPVKNDEEALKLMNDSPYGLTASIWTRDQEVAQQISSEVHTGTCYLNRCDYLDPALAWSGVKDSGVGCTLSHWGYLHLTRPKSFHFKLPS